MKKLVIALGGNALGNTPYEQLKLVTETAKPIVDLIEAGNQVVIAHGNGPQVGMINLAMSTAANAKAIKSDMPFPECGCYAKSLQSFPTLCDPIDGSPPGSPVPGILQARTLEWAAISFSSA